MEKVVLFYPSALCNLPPSFDTLSVVAFFVATAEVPLLLELLNLDDDVNGIMFS